MPFVTIAEIKGRDGRVILPTVQLLCENEYSPKQIAEIRNVFTDIFSPRFINRCTATLNSNNLSLKTLNTGLNNVDVKIARSIGNGLSLERALNILVPVLNSDLQSAIEETMVSPITYDQTSVSEQLANKNRLNYGPSEITEDKQAGTVMRTAASFRVVRANAIKLPEFLLRKASLDHRHESLTFVQQNTTTDGDVKVKSYEISTGGVDSSTLLKELRIFREKLDAEILRVVEHEDDDKDDTMVEFVANLKGKKTSYFVPKAHIEQSSGFALKRENTFESVQSMVQNLFKNELSDLKKMDEELRSSERNAAQNAQKVGCWPFGKKKTTKSADALAPFNPSDSTGSSNTNTPPKPNNR